MIRHLLAIPIVLICITLSAQEILPHNPTIDQVAAYLRSYLDEPPTGFVSYFWVDDAPLRYADVNGDGEDDLIAQGWLFVAVMLWEGDSYSEPLQVIDTASPESGAWSHISLEDWTLDGVLDIKFDKRMPITGAGFEGNTFYRTIISCELLCSIAWEGQIAEYIAVASEEGMYLSESDMTVIRNDQNRVILDVVTRDFAFHCIHALCAVSGERIEQDRFQSHSRIGATTRTRYLWDGLEFLRSEVLTLIDASIMPANSRLSATKGGISASIHFDEQCQLWFNEMPIGEAFLCEVDFTQIYWRENLLILETAYFTEESIVIFDSAGEELLRTWGAIRDIGLFGVRLSDNTILSAGTLYSDTCPQQQCWFELNQDIQIIELP